MQREPLPYFTSLLGARGIAVLLVVLCHLNAMLDRQYGVDWRFFASGWNGVYFFFVLSGFLISRKLFWNLKTEGMLRVRDYFRRRLRRTWPAYFAFLAVLVFLQGWHRIPRIEPKVFYYMTFTQNFFSSISFLPSWTLAAEEQFYLLAPLLVLGIVAAPWLIGPAVFVVALSRYFILPGRTLLVALDSLLFGFAIGWLEIHRHRLYDRLRNRSGICLGLGLVLIYGSIASHIGLTDHSTWLYFAQGLGFALVLLSLLNAASRAARFASWPGFAAIGRISYSLYLVHALVMEMLTRYAMSLPAYIASVFLGLAAASFLLFNSVEKRFTPV